MEPPEKWSQNICQLNISWYHKTLAPQREPFKNWFLGGPFGGSLGGGTLKLCQNICLLNIYWYQNQGVEPNLNPNEPFHFGEPEPNLNQQNFTSVNLNQTWTLKIVLKWTQTEPEPLTKVRIYFSISGCRWCRYMHNKSSGDHQQDQQFLLFFSGRNE